MRSPLSILRIFALILVLGSVSTAMAADQTYRVETFKEKPPESLSPKVLESLNEEGFRIADGLGKTFVAIWFRKAIPASAVPTGSKGAVQFPFLGEGEFLGVLQFVEEGRDYRDQTIAKGVYTLRFGLQPLGGSHRGVSPYRDFALLLPAAKDLDIADIPRTLLHETSAETAGATHPACLSLIDPPKPPTAVPSMEHSLEKATWGANLPIKLSVKDSTEVFTHTIQWIVVGIAMN